MNWPAYLWPTHLRPDRIATRIALVMAGAMLLTQSFGYLLFLADHAGWWPHHDASRLGDLLRPVIERALADPAAHDTQEVSIAPDISVSLVSHFAPLYPVRAAPPFERFGEHLLTALAPHIDQVIVETRMAPPPPGPPLWPHRFDPREPLVLWLRLEDGSWLKAAMPLARLLPPPPFPSWLPWAWTLGIIIVISYLAARGITATLGRLAAAADALGANMSTQLPPEAGPRETRGLTRAFARMQERLLRFVEDRTRVLAAISHDLRTPLSRLKLRAERLPSGPERTRMLADLDLMERMLGATLAFARDDVAGEARQKLDLAALIATVCDEAADAGADITYTGPDHLTIDGAPMALTRAIGNVVDNAVKHGGSARVSLECQSSGIVILVSDQGPGIPEAMRERVFEPFFRLDPARASDVHGPGGGVGLGLAIARQILRAHGGDVTLDQAPSGGLRVRLTLPGAIAV
ncbi:sensor histidine kinase [Dongia sp.]|uniref:sensor histidine kinase n=1 Tax=Dongia sp. TaxID=1977262 RepID=UPI0035B04EC0